MAERIEAPPLAPGQLPLQSHYRLLSASRAVRANLVAEGFPWLTFL